MSKFGSPRNTVSSSRSPTSSSLSSPRAISKPYHPVFKITDQTTNDLNYSEINNLIESYKSQLSSLKKMITSMADCLIAEISLNSTRALETLIKIEENLISQIRSFTDSSALSKKSYFYLSKSLLQLPNLDSHISKAVSVISETFTFDFLERFPIPSEISKDFIFYFNTKGPSFNKIDLDSKLCKTSPADEKFNCVFSAGCELQNGIFFLHSGSKHYEASSECCIYYVYLDKVEKLPNSNFARNGSACVKKDEKIYVFGSSSPISRSCENFDLAEFTWKKMGNLPKEAPFPTGSLVGQNILITAVGLNGFWVFDEINENYEMVEFEVSAGYKVICENFLVSNDGLFEIRRERNNWVVDKFQVKWISNPLAISAGFRKKGYVFFIDSHLRLYRIDPNTKSMIEVRYDFS